MGSVDTGIIMWGGVAVTLATWAAAAAVMTLAFDVMMHFIGHDTNKTRVGAVIWACVAAAAVWMLV